MSDRLDQQSQASKEHDHAGSEHGRDDAVDFNYYESPEEGGTGSMRQVHVSEPVSGGSVVSWTEVLKEQRQRPPGSDDHVSLGSLAELQIDSVSDKSILRQLENEARIATGADSGILVRTQKSTRQSGILRKGSILPDADALAQAKGDSASSIDLRTAARTADKGMVEPGSHENDSEDALSDALMTDDGSSAINLGLEPRVANLLSSAALVRELHLSKPAPEPDEASVSKPIVVANEIRRNRPPLGWLGGVALGLTISGALGLTAWHGGWLPSAPASSPRSETRPLAAAEPKTADVLRQEQLRFAELESRFQALDAANKTTIDKLRSIEADSQTAKKSADDERAKFQAQLQESNGAFARLQQEAAEKALKSVSELQLLQEKESQARISAAQSETARKQSEAQFKAAMESLKVESEAQKSQLTRVRTADSLLELWPILLSHPSQQVAAAAMRDVDPILNDPKADPTTRAKARAVQGLALAACNKFSDARKVLVDLAGEFRFPAGSDWHQRVTDAEPLIRSVRRQLEQGEYQQALAAIQRGLKIHDSEAQPAIHRELKELESFAHQHASKPKGNSELAERHFATGMRHYFGRRFDDAETEFLAAVEQYPDDARYRYFLGLARMPLGKVDAAGKDAQAARSLEKQGKPATTTLNRVFERVQGPARHWLDAQRN
jgi:hypothetical protein